MRVSYYAVIFFVLFSVAVYGLNVYVSSAEKLDSETARAVVTFQESLLELRDGDFMIIKNSFGLHEGIYKVVAKSKGGVMIIGPDTAPDRRYDSIIIAPVMPKAEAKRMKSVQLIRAGEPRWQELHDQKLFD